MIYSNFQDVFKSFSLLIAVQLYLFKATKEIARADLEQYFMYNLTSAIGYILHSASLMGFKKMM